jgi:hypothetical protein
MTTIINGWNVCVEKEEPTISSQLSINNLWISDEVILVVKDYLYISRLEIKRKFYKFAINSSTLRMSIMNPRFLSNSLGLPRLVYWVCLLTDDCNKEIHLQNLTYIDCEEQEPLANNEDPNTFVEVDLTVAIIPEDNLTVESNHLSLQCQSKHSGQWSIVSNDNQHCQDFAEWDNDGQDFGYDSDWFTESRDV